MALQEHKHTLVSKALACTCVRVRMRACAHSGRLIRPLSCGCLLYCITLCMITSPQRWCKMKNPGSIIHFILTLIVSEASMCDIIYSAHTHTHAQWSYTHTNTYTHPIKEPTVAYMLALHVHDLLPWEILASVRRSSREGVASKLESASRRATLDWSQM